jgi:ketosteroid isomerase-like protein
MTAVNFEIDDVTYTEKNEDDQTTIEVDEGTHSEKPHTEDAEMLLERAVQELDEEVPDLISEEEFYRHHGHGDRGASGLDK